MIMIVVVLIVLPGCERKWWEGTYKSEEEAMIDDLSASFYAFEEKTESKIDDLESQIDDLESRLFDLELKLL